MARAPRSSRAALRPTLSATATSSGEVDLGWGQAGDNVGVTGYEVFRRGGESCTDLTQIGQIAGTSTSYADKTVAAGSSYSYLVRAVDAAATSARSDCA